MITASLNNLRMSARKARLIANLIKGMDVILAKAQLKFLIKKGSILFLKLLDSAVANAKNNSNLEEKNLYIKSALVDSGRSLKRWMPRAMGRATPIMKRTCHISIILEEIEDKNNKNSDKLIFKNVKNTKNNEKDKNASSEDKKVKQKLIRRDMDDVDIKDDLTVENDKKYQKEIRPLGASGQSKKRYFSRSTFGNLKRDAKKIFRRKNI